MSEKIAFFLPTRKGSERVKNKNTKPFADIAGGLVENKIKQVLETKLVDEIILSTNDETCMEIAGKYACDNRLKIIPRPDYLCLSTTNLQDLITYVPTITDAAHIVWGHVTTPLTNGAIYDEGIQAYLDNLEKGYDSLIGVNDLRNFILDHEGRIINNTTNLPWPRTQDLEPLYEVNHTMFITSRNTYITEKNRLGKHPYLFVMDKRFSFDIDWPEDFSIAEIMYRSLYK